MDERLPPVRIIPDGHAVCVILDDELYMSKEMAERLKACDKIEDAEAMATEFPMVRIQGGCYRESDRRCCVGR